jgi:uncharacterized protein
MSKDEDEIKKMIGQMDPIKNSVINACDAGALPLLQVLIEGGGDVNTADEQGYTILMNACAKGYVDIVKYLMENGADVTMQDHNGNTALDSAMNAHQEEIAELLKGK